MDDFAITRDQMENTARTIYNFMKPTPQYNWPLLSERVGTEVWVKHENHTPTGAFKIRGGIVYVDYLRNKKKAVIKFAKINENLEIQIDEIKKLITNKTMDNKRPITIPSKKPMEPITIRIINITV